MPDDEIKRIIDLAIKSSIAEYKKSGLLKDSDNVAYSDVCEILTGYYNSDKTDQALTYAIQGQRFDPYFKIIPMYFEDKKGIEAIAEELGVERTTILRNKKRLCLAIYNEII